MAKTTSPPDDVLKAKLQAYRSDPEYRAAQHRAASNAEQRARYAGPPLDDD